MNKIKQVIIIRKDLKMRQGKAISQACHASLGAILSLMEERQYFDDDHSEFRMILNHHEPVYKWISEKFTKICVYVNSEKELLDLYNEAKNNRILCSLIQDAGDTEFKGIPTYTTVAIGPDYSSKIDPLTQDLPLL